MSPALRTHKQRRIWCGARVYLIPALVLLAVTLPHLGQGDLRGDAGWYSAIGLQAWRTGDLWTLYGEPGQPYFNKPPLAFWIHGLVLRVMGLSVLAARLPSVLAALGCVLLTVAIGRELGGRRAGLFSGVVLALSLEFFRRVREISLDMWQLLFMLMALVLVVAGVNRDRRWLLVAAGAPLGLALLCKPLTALVVIPMLGVWLVWIGRGRWLGWLAGAAGLAVAIAGVWHGSMLLIHGQEFAAQYFGAEIADRAAGKLADPNRGGPPVWFYVRQIVAGYWPWLVLVGAGALAWRRSGAVWSGGRGPRLALVWTVGWLVVLSIYADRRDRYGLPMYPGLAWLAAIGALAWAGPTRRWLIGTLPRLLAVAVPCIGVVLAVLPVNIQGKPEPQWPELFEWVRSSGLADGAGDRLWQGGFPGDKGARLYLEFGWWPRTTRNRWGDVLAEPPPGARLIYHRRSDLSPGPNEEVVFHSRDVSVTRLGPGGWAPVKGRDPGE